MTLQAVEPVRVTVPEWQEWITPVVPRRCQIPGCAHAGTQWHHVVPRSATAGPKDWISIDGLVTWNKIRVCLWCHDRINSHKYWIVYDGGWQIYAREKMPEDASTSLGTWMQHSKSGDWFAHIGEVREETNGAA